MTKGQRQKKTRLVRPRLVESGLCLLQLLKQNIRLSQLRRESLAKKVKRKSSKNSE
jgi:hypothetical protein